MVLGWESSIISKLMSSPFDVEDYTNKYWKSGDAIYYEEWVTPFIHDNMWSRAAKNPVISVDTGINWP